MRIFEAIQNTVIIYPGRFHPFHKGHASVYNYLKNKYDSVYIATSNKIDPPKSPFSFAEKRAMMVHAGIPAGAIVQSKQPYRAEEILRNFDPSTTSVAFAVSEKDMEEDPRFSFRPKKDGSPSYFQPMPADEATMVGFDTHGYITTVPTLDFTVLGEPMRSATELRRNFAKADDETQKSMITDLYGAYDEDIHNIMRNKIKEHVDPYAHHILAAESVFADLNTLYEHKQFDTDKVLEHANKIVDRINSISVVETLDYLDPNDAMDSIVAVPGVGTMSIRGLMSNIKDKMSELADKADSSQPSAFRDIKYRMDSNIIGVMMDALVNAFDDIENIRRKGGTNSKSIPKNVFDSVMHMHEAWSAKYKRSINCNNPKGFSQRAHCAGRKKTEDIVQEYVFQSIPLRVLDNLSSRKDNRPFPIKTGDNETFDVTPEIARKFMNLYYQKEPEVQKAIDKTLNNPRKFIELFTGLLSGKKISGANVADIAPDKLTADINELKIERPDAADTMGIERIKMPQVKKDDYAEYLDYLKDAGASFTKETVPARSLKAMQKEFSDAGILKQMQRDPSGKQKPLIASSDDYIIDGHHRWLVAVNTGQSLPIYRIDMPGAELLTLTLNFPKVTFKSIYESAGVGIINKQNTTQDVKPGETERQSKKLGLGGKPKLLHKKAAKNSDPNKLFNLGIAEIYTPLALAIMEGGHNLPDFDIDESPYDTIVAINKKLTKQRHEREDELKAQLYRLMRKAMIATPGSKVQRDIINKLNPIRKQLMMDPIAITEAFVEPQFDVEWDEAARYPEFVAIGKEAWIKLAKKGKAVTITDASDIENTDAADPDSFKQLEPAKQKRALAQLEKGEVEMPIVAVYSDGYKELIGGNTRLTAMMAEKGKATVWQFEVPDEVATLAEAPKDRDSMNLDADKLQQSIDYFYTDHAPKNFGSATTQGNFKGLKVVTFTKGSDTLMFLVNDDDQAVFYVMYSKFNDGVAIGNVRSNGTVKATEVYAYLVDKFGTLYSDDSQTPQGSKIWTSLAKFYPNLDVKDTGGRFVATLAEAVSQVDIDQLERFADKMFAKVGIDVEFGRHFMDRVNDKRNGKPITPAELTRLFKQEYKRYGKPIAQMGPEQQAVMKDLQTDINIPFMLQWDEENNELDLIAKTVMRKKDFKTSNREFAVERGGINVPFASGNFASIVPHRALKIKKPTPGRLSYDQSTDNRKRNNRG